MQWPTRRKSTVSSGGCNLGSSFGAPRGSHRHVGGKGKEVVRFPDDWVFAVEVAGLCKRADVRPLKAGRVARENPKGSRKVGGTKRNSVYRGRYAICPSDNGKVKVNSVFV